MRFAPTILPLALSAVAAAAELHGAGDPRFALAGSGGKAFAQKLGLSYYSLEGNYTVEKGQVFSSVDPVNDPSRGFHVVRKVAKLNVRIDTLGESNAQFQDKLVKYAQSLAVWYPVKWGKKPDFPWYVPRPDSLAAAESVQIVRAIRREKAVNPPITGTVWEIGNEPNLFPAITPKDYAAIFDRFYRIIKSEDPSAQVAMGPIFMPELADDLKAKLQEVTEKIGADLQAKLEHQVSVSGLSGVIKPAGYVPNIIADLKAVLLSRMLAESTPEYLGRVLAEASARPDLITLHVYPYYDRPPYLSGADISRSFDATLERLNALLSDEDVPATYWITEFGNLNPGFSETRVAAQTHDLIAAFKANPHVARWFYYKAVGSDDQLALISSGSPPLTRLSIDQAFVPADGNFPCARLNAIGRAYYQESHGSDCSEYVGFASPASARTGSGPGLPIKVRLDAPSDAAISVEYGLAGNGAEGNAEGNGAGDGERNGFRSAGTLVFAPGETEQRLPADAGHDLPALPGDSLRWVLRNVVGAALSADSLHHEIILAGDDAPPVIDSIWGDKSVLSSGDSMVVRVAAEDAEGDPLAYAWTDRAGTLLGRGSALTLHAGNKFGRSDTVSIAVSDGRGGSASGAFAYSTLASAPQNKATSPPKGEGPIFNLAATSLGGKLVLLQYQLGVRGNVSVQILDALGGMHAKLIDRVQAPGMHSLLYDARASGTGSYYCRLRAAGAAQTIPIPLKQ